MNWIQILKNKFMSKKKTQGNNTFYVWIKSERIGQIVEVAEEQSNPAWTQFTDGTQCNSALIHEFLMGADSEDQANKIAVDFGGITTFTKPESATPVRPRRDIETVDATPVRPRREPVAEINVMQEMLKKMSAKNKAEMPVKINIPSKEIYALLKDQMDITKKDLNSQIAALVEDQIDNLRQQLKEQIESFINNYYNGRTNTNNRTGSDSNSDTAGDS
tara:strand:+ start:328 stop:981 length:654 start_codon:yes stop_codon:yes gene_type:complete